MGLILIIIGFMCLELGYDDDREVSFDKVVGLTLMIAGVIDIWFF